MTAIATIAVVVLAANAAFSLWKHNLDAAVGWTCAALWAVIAARGGV